jgi:phage terminase large subunit-like protein
MVTALVRNWREEAELLFLAPTKEVAENAWKPAVAMIKADPDLRDLLHIQNHYKTITHRKTNAVLKVIAAASETVSGKKAGFVFIDELWEFGGRADAGDMMLEATGGLASRPEGFVVYASTQSDKEPAGVFKEKLAYHRGVRDGVVDDPRSLPVIFEYPEAMIEAEAYLDPATWYITNPNLGRSVHMAFLTQEKAKAFDPTAQGGKKQAFLAKHLNIEIGLKLANDRWRGADYWEAAVDPTLTLDELIARSEVAVVGIDGGGLDDLQGLAVVGRDRVTKDWLAWGTAWAHDDVLMRRKDIESKLLDLKMAGDLVITPDPTLPAIEAADLVERIRDSGLLPEKHGVGIDPLCVGDLVDELNARQIEGEQLAAIRQGFALSPAIWTAETRLKKKTLRHCGQPLMAWCVGNAKAEVRGGAVIITKQTAGRAKIDPLVALFNALILMSRNPEAAAKEESVYEKLARLRAEKQAA